MVCGHGLKSIGVRRKCIDPAGCRRHACFSFGAMTNLAVVVFLCLVIKQVRTAYKRSSDKPALGPRAPSGDHILVFVMGKFDGELLGPARVAKAEARVISRRGFGMTDRANDGLRSFEKLPPVTAYAGIMTGKISNVREGSGLLPICGGCLMTGVTGALMLPGGMKEL